MKSQKEFTNQGYRANFQFPSGYEYLLKGLPKKQLTTEQEDDLAIKIQAAKKKGQADQECLNDLALYNMREALFYGLACARSRQIDAGTIFSLCWAALCAAAPNFEAGRIRFFAYAKPYVRGEIIKAFHAQKVVRHGETRSLTPDTIGAVTDHEEAGDVSFTHSSVDIDDLLLAKADVVEADTEGIMVRDEWSALLPVIQTRLSEKERMVLELKYQSGFNFRQIGDLLRVSRSDTQATHTRAINKVRCALKGKRELFCR